MVPVDGADAVASLLGFVVWAARPPGHGKRSTQAATARFDVRMVVLGLMLIVVSVTRDHHRVVKQSTHPKSVNTLLA